MIDINFDAIKNAQLELHRLTLANWLEHGLFSFNWWLMLLVMFVPWLIWWKLVHKDRLMEILLFGLFIALASGILDTIGFSIGLWGYPNRLLPINPPLFPADFSLLPVTYMLVFQYITGWIPFLLATIIISGIFTYVGEPFLVWLDVYETYLWKYIFSFPIYIAMPLFFKWLVEKIMIIVYGQAEDSIKDLYTKKFHRKKIMLIFSSSGMLLSTACAFYPVILKMLNRKTKLK